VSRTLFFVVLYAGFSGLQGATGIPLWNYYRVLWVIPLFTSFPLFMIMRQWVQHGNADRGRLSNTRVFLVNPFIRYAVFPFGMDYHLPHHIYAAVPHFALPALNNALMRDPAYSNAAITVEGYFRSPAPERGNPTVVEVLGPAYAASSDDVFIASDALEDADITGRDHIVREEKYSGRGLPTHPLQKDS